MKQCEMCKQYFNKLVGNRLCEECFDDAPAWIQDMVSVHGKCGKLSTKKKVVDDDAILYNFK